MPTYDELTTKKAQVEFIRSKLRDNERWAIKGLLTIYKYQTQEEQAHGVTHDNNGVGFSGADSIILSSFAEQVAGGRSLSIKQLAVLYRTMPKYAKQLQRISSNAQ